MLHVCANSWFWENHVLSLGACWGEGLCVLHRDEAVPGKATVFFLTISKNSKTPGVFAELQT